MKEEYDIFISYSSKERKTAYYICDFLEKAGFTCWIAPRNIPVGSSYPKEINKAIKTSKLCLLILSNASASSIWVQKEMNTAINLQKSIIPYCINKKITTTDFFEFLLADTQQITSYPSYKTNLKNLTDAIQQSLPNTEKEKHIVQEPPKKKNNFKLLLWIILILGICAIIISLPMYKHYKHLQRQSVIDDIIKNMVYIEGGEYIMGATSEQEKESDPDEYPPHKVLVNSFYIGRYEVTQAEWVAIMGRNPSKFKDLRKPVEFVSWYDCHQFIDKLNQLTNRNFRLPTEEEWEFAARGGIHSRGYKYSGSDTLQNVGWYRNNSNKTTHVGGQKSSNELYIYDMSGNIWEWCESPYKSYSDSSIITTDTIFTFRIGRGGCWFYDEIGCRVSDRSYNKPDYRNHHLGLRLAE